MCGQRVAFVFFFCFFFIFLSTLLNFNEDGEQAMFAQMCLTRTGQGRRSQGYQDLE